MIKTILTSLVRMILGVLVGCFILGWLPQMMRSDNQWIWFGGCLLLGAFSMAVVDHYFGKFLKR